MSNLIRPVAIAGALVVCVLAAASPLIHPPDDASYVTVIFLAAALFATTVTELR